jgi:hypothetical protein
MKKTSMLVAALALLLGCAGSPREKPAAAAFEAGRFDECARLYSGALDDFRAISKAHSPSEGKHWDGEEGIQRALYGRAQCKKAAGDVGGAIADLDASMAKMKELSDIPKSRVLDARLAALSDMAEKRAQWSRDLKR